MREKFDTELMKRDLEIDRLKNKFDVEEKSYTEKIDMIEEFNKKKEETLKELRKEFEKTKTELKKSKSDIANLNREKVEFEKKIEDLNKKAINSQRKLTKHLNPEMLKTVVGESGLQEVYDIIQDIEQKLDNLRELMKDGFSERGKSLSESIMVKDNELLDLIQENDTRLREVKSEANETVKMLKVRQDKETKRLKDENNDLMMEKLDLIKKIGEYKSKLVLMESLKTKLAQSDVIIRELEEQVNSKAELISTQEQVITTFVKQIQEKDSLRAEFEYRYSKLKDLKKNFLNSRERIFYMFRQIVIKFVKKKNHDLKSAYENLKSDEKKMFLEFLNDVGVNIERYI